MKIKTKNTILYIIITILIVKQRTKIDFKAFFCFTNILIYPKYKHLYLPPAQHLHGTTILFVSKKNKAFITWYNNAQRDLTKVYV